LLGQEFGPLRIAAELTRLRDSANRLVSSPWAQRRIRVLSRALLRHGSLSAEQIYELA
jgi:hypothetical protein